jgi:hypothetical protein
MEPLSFSDAVFRVSLALGDTPVDQAKPLDQRLLAQADPPLSPRRWGPHIEVVFVLMALGCLATWMIRVSLARRPSLGLVTAAILLACVLIGVFPTGALDRFVVVLQARPEFMLVEIVALSAFLGALSVVAALLRMRGSGHVLRATVAGRLLLVSCALLAPLVTVGVMLACLTLGSFFTGSIFGSLPDAPILGSLPDAPPSLAELKSLSFAMMALPIVLGVAGVLAVVIMQRSWAVGSIAPALLVVISVGLVQMPALVATAVPIAPIPVQEIYDPARVNPTLWQLPPRDDTELFSAGNDHLTYSALPKAFLHNPQPENYLLLNTPEQLLTKPLFMYFRAARYALLGDGEFYSLALARALITWVIAVCGVLCLAAIGATQGVLRARDSRSRIGMGLLAGSAALTWVWLAYAMATPSDFFLLLSEGGALASVLLSFGVLVVASGRSLLLCGVAGAIFAISVLYRSTHLPLAFLGLAIVGLGFGGSASRWVRASIAYIAPIATAVLVIWLHAGAPISMPRSMGSYTAYNLGPPQAPPGSFIQGLVPNVLTLQITCAVLLAIVIALVMGATTSMRVRVACLGLAVIIGALLPLLPQRGAPYYPRSLVTAYYALAFLPAALLIDRWQRPPSDGGNGNAGPG